MSASIKSFGRGRAAGLVLIALVGLGLAYLHFSGGSASVSVPSGAHAGQLTLKHCTYVNEPADCGTLVVPENRHDPHSRLIALPITRVRAHTPHPGVPIFRLQGRIDARYRLEIGARIGTRKLTPAVCNS